ncbi:MAG: 2-isopropylmalate synthase [Ruminococcaceae bacterium]|nr:2-isopropylmalate synthase [Oscillospiraceae bacterium]
MKRKISICDSTIWLGEQTAGYSMSATEKVEIAKQLVRLGVDVVEIGYPYTQNEEAIANICEKITEPIIEVMCDSDMPSAERAVKAVAAAKRGRINISANAGGDAAAVKAAINKVKSVCEAEVSVKNACEVSADALVAFARELESFGADIICVCDGNGSCAPNEFYETVKKVTDAVKTPVSVLCGNDLGMAVANTLAAVRAGASEIKCAVGGVGERAGAAALEEAVAALYAKSEYYNAETGVNTRSIYRTSKLVATVLGYQIVPNRPIIGDNAFNVAEGGDRLIVKPETIGVFRNNLVLGKFSTKADFQTRVTELGYSLTPTQTDECFGKFVELTSRKKSVSDKDIEAIVEPLGTSGKDYFELVNFVINSGNMFPSSATIIMKKNGKETTKVETGSGPIDAAFKAIDRITKIDVSLESFALQSVTEGEDALGDAVVKVKYADRVITGRGISTDVIEASIKAYVNALNKIAATVEE